MVDIRNTAVLETSPRDLQTAMLVSKEQGVDRTNALYDNPADPTAVTSATGLMAGLAEAFTPIKTGRVKITITGLMTGATGDTLTARIVIGTGTAPANGGANTGTAYGNTAQVIALTGVLTQGFTCIVRNAALTVNTAYWIDLILTASAGSNGPTKLAVDVEEY